MLVRDLLMKENMNLVDCIRLYNGENLFDGFCNPISNLLFIKADRAITSLTQTQLNMSVDRYELVNTRDFVAPDNNICNCSGKFLRILIED